MSEYEHNRAVMYPITLELLNKLSCNDTDDLEDRFTTNKYRDKSYFEIEIFKDYEGTRECNYYLSYVIDSAYGEGDFGRSRFLKSSEQEKYKTIFSKVIPENLIDTSLFKYVDYCWYNCCECDDYYVKKDSFEEEI